MYIGIDIGGTKIALGLVDDRGEILNQSRIPTLAKEGPRSALDRMVEEIRRLREGAPSEHPLRGIGIGCAGPVDARRGVVMNPYTLPGWEEFPLAEDLSRRVGVPAQMENDVNTVLLGEVALGGWEDRDVLLVMVGTGVGVAFSRRGGILHRTRSVYHPEMGHLIIEPDGPECYCGRRGCLESLASGSALHRIAAEEGFKDFRNLIASAESGSTAATALLDQAARRLAAGIWNLQIVLQPEVIVLGGGIMDDYFDLFKDKILAFLPGREDFNGRFALKPSHGGDRPALAGAARLIRSFLE